MRDIKLVQAMTDQELNEWVAKKVMGWKIVIDPRTHGLEAYDTGDSCLTPLNDYNFCKDLNHANLMEEKILNTHLITGYLHQLALTVGYVIGDFFGTFPVCDMVNASARQRCEAAYLSVGDLSFE